MFRSRSYCFFLVWLCAATGLVLGLPSIAQARNSFSTDELFEKSMDELRLTMEKVKMSNDSFREQNRLLQQDVETLKEAILEINQQIPQNVQTQKVIIDQALLNEKENALYVERTKNLSARLNRFQDDQRRIQKKIKFYKDDNDSAQKQIAILKEQILQMQDSLRNQKSFMAKSSPASDDLADELAASIQRVALLKKRMDSYQQNPKKSSAQNTQSVKSSLVFSAEIARLEQELARLSVKPALRSNDDQADYRERLQEQISDLQSYRQELRKSLVDLKKALVVHGTVDNKYLENVYRKFMQQQALLKQELSYIENGTTISDKTQLGTKPKPEQIAQKKKLLAQRKKLQDQIAKINNESIAKISSTSGNPDLKNKIAQSSKRIRALQTQITSMRKSLSASRKNEDLGSQVQVLEKNLLALKKNPVDVSMAEDFSAVNLDPQKLIKEITFLGSRRDILAQSLNTIYGKYQVDDFSAKNVQTEQAKLKEYAATLSLENVALQQKFLTLQIRQDKKLPLNPAVP